MYMQEEVLCYYQKSFPEAKIFVSPSVIGNITKENWYTTKDGIDAVNAELPESYISFHFSYKKPASFWLARLLFINRELPENRFDKVHIQCRR